MKRIKYMGILCEGCVDPCVPKLEEADNSSDPVNQKAYELAVSILARGNVGNPGPINHGDQIDIETGMKVGPKMECCNSKIQAAAHVLLGASMATRQD
jgi:hypothetical protein